MDEHTAPTDRLWGGRNLAEGSLGRPALMSALRGTRAGGGRGFFAVRRTADAQP